MRNETHWIFMDSLKRRLFINHELKRLLLKSVIKNNNVSNIIRYYALFKLSLLPKFKLIAGQQNRCVFTGRSYNILRKFKYSRFFLRSQVNQGSVLGWKRYSW